MDIATLKKLFQLSWCAETAYGLWHSRCPSLNQCAVTSLVAQDYLGGNILRREMTNHLFHYLNQPPEGIEIDFTQDQFLFTAAQPVPAKTSVYSRFRLLRDPDIEDRYFLLKELVAINLARINIPAS